MSPRDAWAGTWGAETGWGCWEEQRERRMCTQTLAFSGKKGVRIALCDTGRLWKPTRAPVPHPALLVQSGPGQDGTAVTSEDSSRDWDARKVTRTRVRGSFVQAQDKNQDYFPRETCKLPSSTSEGPVWCWRKRARSPWSRRSWHWGTLVGGAGGVGGGQGCWGRLRALAMARKRGRGEGCNLQVLCRFSTTLWKCQPSRAQTRVPLPTRGSLCLVQHGLHCPGRTGSGQWGWAASLSLGRDPPPSLAATSCCPNVWISLSSTPFLPLFLPFHAGNPLPALAKDPHCAGYKHCLSCQRPLGPYKTQQSVQGSPF